MIKYCFYCKQEIIKDKNITKDDVWYMMIPLDNPYINMFMHLSCYKSFDSWNSIIGYITKNFCDIIDYYKTNEHLTKNHKRKKIKLDIDIDNNLT